MREQRRQARELYQDVQRIVRQSRRIVEAGDGHLEAAEKVLTTALRNVQDARRQLVTLSVRVHTAERMAWEVQTAAAAADRAPRPASHPQPRPQPASHPRSRSRSRSALESRAAGAAREAGAEDSD